ncbi:MAG: ABC transporter ATP-binding protein [Beijerinckiaceae bacterium]
MAHPSETPDLISADGVTKRFGAFVANDSVSLHVKEREIHALLGENGAGKSTLVKMLFGLLQPDGGVIRWRGGPVAIANPDAARRLGIAMVFQHFSLFDNLTTLENIALGLPGGRADGALRREAEGVAQRYGLAIHPDAEVWSLSAGERQRIEIIRCLLQKPKLLILDEPTSVLTPQEAEALFTTLEKLRDDGASVLFISHKLDEVRRLCTAATILRGGKLVATADPRASSSKQLAALMVGAEVGDVARAGAPANGSKPVLEVVDLTAVSPAVHGMMLRDVNLTVRAGEIVGVAGIAGSGQSELFAALSGESGAPSNGRIRVAGDDVASQGVGGRRARGAAFVPEDRLGHGTLPGATLSENLVLCLPASESASAAGVLRRAKLEALLAEVTSAFDVRASAADPEARRLSGGNLQKYVVGREIARRPKLLVVNQPTWGVDAAAAQRIRQALADLAAQGAAVLMISQDLDEIFELSDRIAVIRMGRLSEALPRPALTREAVGLMMTGGEGGEGAAHAA